MQLTPYVPVPSGLSFTPDTGPAPRKAYVLSAGGGNVSVSLSGTGTWAVDIFTALDGQDWQLYATKALPGVWRYAIAPGIAVAIRVNSFTAGTLTAMLTYGGAPPVTYVSPLFGASLIFQRPTTTTEPPAAGEVRLDSTTLTRVTRVWLHNQALDTTDQFQALRKIPPGGTFLLQDRTTHANAALFRIIGAAIDKTTYVEVPVVYQESIGTFAAAPALVAIFNPGPILSLSPTVAPQDEMALPRPVPNLTALEPPAAPLGSASFTLRVLGYEFASDNVIYWNGAPEPTTFVSSYELRTGVDMSTAQVAMPIPVDVRTVDGALVSNALTFDLGGTPPTLHAPSPDAPAPGKASPYRKRDG